MNFSHGLNFGLTQGGPNSGHQKIPSKKKPVNQSLPLGNNVNTNSSSASNQMTGPKANFNFPNNQAHFDSLNQPLAASNLTSGVQGLASPDRSGFMSMNSVQRGQNLMFSGNMSSTQYASQGS